MALAFGPLVAYDLVVARSSGIVLANVPCPPHTGHRRGYIP